MFLADYLDFAAQPRTWWLYDTFSGIPEDQLDPGWKARNERTYHGTYGVREVVERFAAFPNIKIVQGRVPEVLKAVAPEQIAFLHVDLNNSVAEIAAPYQRSRATAM